MDILSKVQWQSVLVYLDDPLIFLESPETNIKPVRHVLTQFHDACDTVKLQKSKLFSSAISYLIYIIHPGPMAESKQTVEAIRSLNSPSNSTKLQSFMTFAISLDDLYPTSREFQNYSTENFVMIN